MSETELEKLERQYQQARARLDAARARDREHQRKLDARRKIILGGALVERAERDSQMAKLLAMLVAGLSRQHDRKAFEGWPLPGSGAGESETHAAGGDRQQAGQSGTSR